MQNGPERRLRAFSAKWHINRGRLARSGAPGSGFPPASVRPDPAFPVLSGTVRNERTGYNRLFAHLRKKAKRPANGREKRGTPDAAGVCAASGVLCVGEIQRNRCAAVGTTQPFGVVHLQRHYIQNCPSRQAFGRHVCHSSYDLWHMENSNI